MNNTIHTDISPEGNPRLYRGMSFEEMSKLMSLPIQQSLKDGEVAYITGRPGTGKTTLTLELFPHFHFINFENYNTPCAERFADFDHAVILDEPSLYTHNDHLLSFLKQHVSKNLPLVIIEGREGYLRKYSSALDMAVVRHFSLDGMFYSIG